MSSASAAWPRALSDRERDCYGALNGRHARASAVTGKTLASDLHSASAVLLASCWLWAVFEQGKTRVVAFSAR